MIGSVAWKICNVSPCAITVGFARSAGHCVGVDVDRITWVGNRYFIGCTEYISDVPGVTLGAITHEYLIRINYYIS
ncbi:hypothetical protein SDC9_103753 [bioreactor metagenome]|uniref:Uncharacterized protein n=1 Tax=bioreactor metagenome TaxID=1076179 RepID=A0A645AVW2_9ZZZZ